MAGYEAGDIAFVKLFEFNGIPAICEARIAKVLSPATYSVKLKGKDKYREVTGVVHEKDLYETFEQAYEAHTNEKEARHAANVERIVPEKEI